MGKKAVEIPSKITDRSLEFPQEILATLKQGEKAKQSKETYDDWVVRINEFVDDKLRNNSPYIPHILNEIQGKREGAYVKYEGASYRIAERNKSHDYISKKTLSHIIRNQHRQDKTKAYSADRKTILIIACFLEIEVTEANRLINLQFKDGYDYNELLLGAWEVYYYNSAVEKSKAISKTGMFLESSLVDGYHFTVHFRFSIGGKHTTMKGSGYCVRDTLNLEITENPHGFRNRIYVCAQLPDLTDKKKDSLWLINAAAVTNGGESPFLSHLIFVKAQKNKRDILRPVAKPLQGKLSSLELEIATHLKQHPDIGVMAFKPDNIKTLKLSNKTALKTTRSVGYKKLKDIFKKGRGMTWCSFSRVTGERDEVAVFEWKFKFDENTQEAKVTRTRFDAPNISKYTGKAELIWPHLHIRMQKSSQENASYKSYMARIDTFHNSSKSLRGISATTYTNPNESESSNIAIREILFLGEKDGIKNEVVEKKGYLPYGRFLLYPGMDVQDKFYLSSRELSTLSFPSINNLTKHYARLKDAIEEEYGGEYIVLFKNVYRTVDQQGKNLLLATLKIDNLANATLHFKLPKRSKYETYIGRIEQFDRNAIMHLGVNTESKNKQKFSTLLFNEPYFPLSSIESAKLLSGIGLDTDLDHNVGAYPFVMIDKQFLKEHYKEDGLPEWWNEEDMPTQITEDDISSEIYKDVLPLEFRTKNHTRYFFEIPKID